MYDYLIVGAGLFGAVFAYEMKLAGKNCLVIEKRKHIAGNVYTEDVEGIQVHKYGAHIFHTNNKKIWDYVNQFSEFNRYTNSPIAKYKDKIYNLPFNMNTFHQMWGVNTPAEAKKIIAAQIKDAGISKAENLEEQAISLVGRDIYEILVKGYTEKQWGRKAQELPAFIINRLPVRFIYDNNYFNDRFQGIPVGGYTKIIEKMLDGIEVRMNTDFLQSRDEYLSIANKIIYTGTIDAFFDYCYGELGYRSLRFEDEVLDIENYQGNAVVNYTEYEIPYTRIIEHKHFEYDNSEVQCKPKTVVTREFPDVWTRGGEPYYPINDKKNNDLYSKYYELASRKTNIIFGGRLGMFKYFDMHNVIEESLNLVKKELQDLGK